MKCRQARRATERRIDGELGLERGFELEQHLESCTSCRTDWEHLRELDEGLARLAEPPQQGPDLDAMLARLREDREAPVQELAGNSNRLRRVARIVLPLAAASALAAGLLWNREAADGGEFVAPNTELAGGQRAQTDSQVGPAPSVDGARESTLPVAIESANSESANSESTNSELADIELPQAELAQAEHAQATAAPAEPIDNQLLERARDEVRTQLIAAAVPFRAGDIDVQQFASALDDNTRSLKQLGWPVLRIVERLLTDDETQTAGAAARYLGVRGDRSSVRQLALALEQPAVASEATRALADAGPRGIDGLALALASPAQRELACQLLVASNLPQAGAALAATFVAEERERQGEASSDDLVESLVAMGPLAVPALLELGEEQHLSREQLVSALESIPSAGSLLVIELQTTGLSRQAQRTRVQCATSLVPASAASWLQARIHDRPWREFVREQIPQLAGTAAVDALIELNADSRLSSDDLSALVEHTLELDVRRFLTAIEDHRQISDGKWYEVLGVQLVAAQTPLALPAVRELLGTHSVTDELQRELVLYLGEHGDLDDLALLTRLFDACAEDERMLAAACLVAIEGVGGTDALNTALLGTDARTQSNLLHLLRRRKAGTRTTPSIYKLARELRPMLRARATDTRTSSL